MSIIGVSQESKVEEKVIGEIVDTPPTTKRMFKILLPTTFPTAISDSFLITPITDVANSGKEEPIATNVNPITLSESPKTRAVPVAAFKNKSPPKIKAIAPKMRKVPLSTTFLPTFSTFNSIRRATIGDPSSHLKEKIQ